MIWFALGVVVGAAVVLYGASLWAETDQARRALARQRAEDRIRDIHIDALHSLADGAIQAKPRPDPRVSPIADAATAAPQLWTPQQSKSANPTTGRRT